MMVHSCIGWVEGGWKVSSKSRYNHRHEFPPVRRQSFVSPFFCCWLCTLFPRIAEVDLKDGSLMVCEGEQLPCSQFVWRDRIDGTSRETEALQLIRPTQEGSSNNVKKKYFTEKL